MKTILVTGGAGFIGSHLCDRLVARGDRVVCYDNLDPRYDVALKTRNLSGIRHHPAFTFVHGDILDAANVELVLQTHKVTDIVHLAALAGVRASIEQPSLYNQVNVCGSVNVMDAARRCGVSSVVLASSSAVYGACASAPFNEDSSVCRPISPYAAGKLAMEYNGYAFHVLYGMDVICPRFFTVYGPRQRPDMAISRFARAIRAGEEVSMYGDGSSRRDYTYVTDIVDGLLSCLELPRSCGFEIVNLGSSCPVALEALIHIIGDAVGQPPKVHNCPAQAGDVNVTYADIGKARRLLGFEPKTTLVTGIAAYLAWLDEVSHCSQETSRAQSRAASRSGPASGRGI